MTSFKQYYTQPLHNSLFTGKLWPLRQEKLTQDIVFCSSLYNFSILIIMNTGISCVYQGLFQTRAIYLSDLESATDLNLIKSLNITSIVTALKQVKLNYPCGPVKDYLCFPIVDVDSYNISQHFDQVFDFIDRVKQKGNILVHCALGVSRSSALIISYLIRKHRYTVEQSIAFLRKRRPIVNPNAGFVQQLQEYSKKYCLIPNQIKSCGRVKEYRQIHKLQKLRKFQPLVNNYDQYSLPSTQLSAISSENQGLIAVMKQKNQIQERLKAVQKYYKGRLNKQNLNEGNGLKAYKSQTLQKRKAVVKQKRMSV